MCTCSQDCGRLDRRKLLAGLAALSAAAVLPDRALAQPPLSCFEPARLPFVPGEQKPRRPGPADKVVEPVPAAPGSPVPAALAGVIRRVSLTGPKPMVALTFDLCQTHGTIAGYDGAIVDYLRQGATPATFFAGGLWLKTHRERALELVADPIFQVGNHSWSHHNLHGAPAETVKREILLAEVVLAEVRGTVRAKCGTAVRAPANRLFRFPFGSCSDQALATANGIGAVAIQWDVVSGDPDGTSAAAIARAVLSGVRPGSIVVMHANGRGTHTAEALHHIVPALAANGYGFVTVDRLLAEGRAVAATSCYIERVGDTARYDHPAGRRS